MKNMLIMAVLAAFLMLSGIAKADYSCIDNYTIKYSTNISVDGIDIPVIQTELCENGCDNSSSACAPPAYQQNLWTFGIIIAIAVGMVWLYKFGRGRR